MPPPRGEAGNRTPVGNYLYQVESGDKLTILPKRNDSLFSCQMVSATLTKVREIKHAADARPVVLLGWGVGAAIAAHVAGMERLAGLVRFWSRQRSVCAISSCCLKGMPWIPDIHTGWTKGPSWRSRT